jgi:hypothetical protein
MKKKIRKSTYYASYLNETKYWSPKPKIKTLPKIKSKSKESFEAELNPMNGCLTESTKIIKMADAIFKMTAILLSYYTDLLWPKKSTPKSFLPFKINAKNSQHMG